MTPSFLVLDASVAISWVLADENEPYSEEVLECLPQYRPIAPAVWPLEVGNALVMAERRQRLLLIPPLVLHGIMALNNEPVMIINFPDYLYNPADPDEQRLPHDMPLRYADGTEAPYCWFQNTEDDRHK